MSSSDFLPPFSFSLGEVNQQKYSSQNGGEREREKKGEERGRGRKGEGGERLRRRCGNMKLYPFISCLSKNLSPNSFPKT
jgi:hypothetical protein